MCRLQVDRREDNATKEARLSCCGRSGGQRRNDHVMRSIGETRSAETFSFPSLNCQMSTFTPASFQSKFVHVTWWGQVKLGFWSLLVQIIAFVSVGAIWS